MIYFVSDGEYVKIGLTDSDDVDARIAALQTGNARKIFLLGTIEGGREAEAVLHSVFSNLRVRGEWFRVSLPKSEVDAASAIDPATLPAPLALYARLVSNGIVPNGEMVERFDIGESTMKRTNAVLLKGG
jgi:hypothetical protein